MNEYTRAALGTVGGTISGIGIIALVAAVVDGIRWAVTGTTHYHDTVALGFIAVSIIMVGAFPLAIAIDEL